MKSPLHFCEDIPLPIARAINLVEPTSLQGPVYDTFLNHDERVLTLGETNCRKAPSAFLAGAGGAAMETTDHTLQ